ncbi:MAG: M23 family metallopeptidase [Bifidobacterium aquikefiri]|uniref:Peptidase M23 n=1 Tax=Bifidobacterium aquikefiri TaxID=1653207 RepID=A0A261G5R5_9BIFI|nr:M23 family metallopeptidase [Bifidobacterium aquikefiri]OZG66787.1 peptidase M23 [Bifidobacterium aquikefiri]
MNDRMSYANRAYRIFAHTYLRKQLQDKQACLQFALPCMIACWICALPWLLQPDSTALASTAAHASVHADCRAIAIWPVENPTITQEFIAPAQQWSSGHRGIDMQTQTGQTLVSPVDGVVSFQGKVAQKSVVSVQHGAMTFTFEPAVTWLAAGERLTQGQPFATVENMSDHCEDSCLHWGLKRGSDYLDPASRVAKTRIVLKAQ